MKPELETIFAYSFHTSAHLMDCAARLPDADYHWQPGYGHGSIHNVLFHVLRVWNNWRGALQTVRSPARLSPDDYGSLALLQAGFAREQTEWSAYVGALSEEQIANNVELVTRRGDKVTFVLWRLLQHQNFHAMQHHSEIAQLLTIKGQSPGDIDFLFFHG